MSEGLVAAIARGWRDPRGEMARQIAEGLSESRALLHLFTACGLALLASLPNAVRNAQGLEIEEPLSGVISAHIFGYLLVAPLLLYGFAALVHLGAKAFGARGGYLQARSAVFWAALMGAPIAMGLALVGVAAEIAGGAGMLRWIGYLGYAGILFWLWLLAASLAEAEGFGPTYRVAAVLVAGFGLLALAVRSLGGAAVALS